jgi:LacI family sucrose operon transcriptional repressor
MTPALTTVKYPYFGIGDMAIDTIEKMIVKGEVPESQILSNELVIKETTKKI